MVLFFYLTFPYALGLDILRKVKEHGITDYCRVIVVAPSGQEKALLEQQCTEFEVQVLYPGSFDWFLHIADCIKEGITEGKFNEH
ncbi:MAG: hypothetical protein A2293_04735 [Elusimicrobia bacterium RIFOXYB2_FULL_49_7]|nr:MAG: hypothetical protein A2293_04735 [Elusimicrobia bacterium RIFOXYB2_FULL_49_7]